MADVSLELLDRHRTELEGAAIRPEVLTQAGVVSVERAEDLPHGVDDWWKQRLPAKLYPWSMNGHATWQLAPDDRTDGPKYVFPEGSEPPLNCFRDSGEGPILLAEGTKQHLSVASYAPPEFAVYGMFGCWGWSGRDFSFAHGRAVWVILDADFSTNRDVWNAARGLQDTLEAIGAKPVLFVSVPGSGKTGIDDFLATMPDERRTEALANLMEKAQAKLPRAPAKKRDAASGSSRWFTEDGRLLAMDTARQLAETYPVALTHEQRVAIYRDGVYRINPGVFIGTLVQMLKNDFRPQHRGTIEETMVGILTMVGRVLPDRLDEPVMNVRNGMVDLQTGELLEHDPGYMSTVQFPVEYNPEATCPTFDAWAAEIIGGQLNDLEEAASQMLDPSMTPTKALLLFGPSRSGKSTYLRLLEKVAGLDNVSAVTLHELSEDHFAAAQLYGKVLNTAADLSARHVEDISRFKMMTGEDRIRGNRKYGKDFFFVNQALFAFSTNEIPTVGESSRAYSERIKPFKFGSSFAGREDHTIEIRMSQELPGILNRLVRARQRRVQRGHDLFTAPEIRAEFERASDRVQMWLEEEMRIVIEHDGRTVIEGMSLPTDCGTAPTPLTDFFNEWAQENHMAGLGRKGLIQRLTSRDGVGIVNVRLGRDKKRGLNLVKRNESDNPAPESTPSGSLGLETATAGLETATAQTPSSDPVSGQVSGRSGSFKRIDHRGGTQTELHQSGQSTEKYRERGDSEKESDILDIELCPTPVVNAFETATSATAGAESALPPAETGGGSFAGQDLLDFTETATAQEDS